MRRMQTHDRFDRSPALPTCFLASLAACAAVADTLENVALGRPVTASGIIGSAPSSLATVTDGVFLPAWTQWQSGTVWWSGRGSELVIDLGRSVDVVSVVVQADDNDAYLLEHLDPQTGQWARTWSVPNFHIFNGVDFMGMQTRPNPYDTGAVFSLPAPVQTDRLRILADTSGDGSFSVSEVQAFAWVPSPCPTDFDGNRVVDSADVALLLLDYGPCAVCAGDLDGNGEVDGADVALLLLEFGACP